MSKAISRATHRLSSSPERLLLGSDDERTRAFIDRLKDQRDRLEHEVARLWLQVNLHRDDTYLTHCAAERDGAKCGVVVDRDITDLPLCTTHLGQAKIDIETWEAGRDKSRPAPAGTPAVYYFRWHGSSRIKIGTTTNLKARMRSLYVQPEDLLAVEPGDSKREAERHRQFAASRVNGTELFERTPELDAHVQQVRDTFGDPKQFI